MGKWSAFLISLIPAALAGYLCFLLVTIGLPAADEMGTMFWGPLGAGFLACVMCLLAPFGIAIFVKSAPKPMTVSKTSESAQHIDDDLETADSQMLSGEVAYDEEETIDDSSEMDFVDEEDDDFDYAASSEYESAELASDEFSDEFDAFEDDYEDDEKK